MNTDAYELIRTKSENEMNDLLARKPWLKRQMDLVPMRDKDIRRWTANP